MKEDIFADLIEYFPELTEYSELYDPQEGNMFSLKKSETHVPSYLLYEEDDDSDEEKDDENDEEEVEEEEDDYEEENTVIIDEDEDDPFYQHKRQEEINAKYRQLLTSSKAMPLRRKYYAWIHARTSDFDQAFEITWRLNLQPIDIDEMIIEDLPHKCTTQIAMSIAHDFLTIYTPNHVAIPSTIREYLIEEFKAWISYQSLQRLKQEMIEIEIIKKWFLRCQSILLSAASSTR
jgi:hypothetical protein